jgi:FixJ family two-component response regulator
MKVLFISGYTENTISQHDVLEGGAAFLAKPFGRETLGRRVREALGERRSKKE